MMGGGYPAEQMDNISGRAITLDFPRGAVLCAYIDGLVERHDQSIDHESPSSAPPSAPPSRGCLWASVMAAMARYSPHTDGSGPTPPSQQVTGLRRIEALPGRVGTPK